MTKLNIKEAVERTSLWKSVMVILSILGICTNLVTLSFFVVNQCLFAITRGL